MNLDFQTTHKHIYFIGIGGISMSGLAQILQRWGCQVAGSDMKPSEATHALEQLGIPVFYGQETSHILPETQLVVYTAAIRDDNPELMAARAAQLPTIERSVLLGAMMAHYHRSVAVSGTHGKTTTTSMLSHIFLAAHCDPTITVGGVLPIIGGNIRVGNSDYFLAEACEYHNSFLEFQPLVGIILNVEAEHLDFFKDLADVEHSFHAFAQNIPAEGALIIHKDIPGFPAITEGLSCRIITYGMGEDAQWHPADLAVEDGKDSFTLIGDGKAHGRVQLHIPGDHNVLNALAAAAASYTLGLEEADIVSGLNSYHGVNRRFQKKGVYHGTEVIDDYAHHPTEIKATLAAAKKVAKGTLWCVFQPHTYTRAKLLLEDFGKAFADADRIIVTDIYAAREKDTGLIHSREIAQKIKDNGKDAQYLSSFDEIVTYLKSTLSPDDMLITMGAGDVYLVGEKLLEA